MQFTRPRKSAVRANAHANVHWGRHGRGSNVARLSFQNWPHQCLPHKHNVSLSEKKIIFSPHA